MSGTLVERLRNAVGSERHGPLEDGSYSLALISNVNLCGEAADRIAELEAGIAEAAAELDAVHHQDRLDLDGSRHGLCVRCVPVDGSWPCVSRMVADDLRQLLTEVDS